MQRGGAAGARRGNAWKANAKGDGEPDLAAGRSRRVPLRARAGLQGLLTRQRSIDRTFPVASARPTAMTARIDP